MDRAVLLQRKKVIESQFNQLSADSNIRRQKINEDEDELKRLQGQYREIEELLKLVPEIKPSANMVIAEPVENISRPDNLMPKEKHERQAAHK